MTRVGGLTHRYYKQTRGLKVSGGEPVKAGTLLTREGHKWKPGKNVAGDNHLTATVDGEIYFTHRKNSYNKMETVINIKPAPQKKASSKK